MKKHSFKVSQAMALMAASTPLLLACSGEMPQTGENYRSSEQALTGAIEVKGRITSPTGAPISGVKVTLTGAANKSVTTGASGTYSFAALAAGSYTVTPTKAGLAFCTPSSASELSPSKIKMLLCGPVFGAVGPYFFHWLTKNAAATSVYVMCFFGASVEA